jgi:hypothetical protein
MYPWQEFYDEAVLETDPAAMPKRVEMAANAIRARQVELSQDHQGTPEEREAIRNALNGLEALRGERL